MGSVFANGRSILHKGDGNTHIAAPPDVCKVPTPGGPVPTPFVNSAQDSMLAKGSKKTVIDGNPVVLATSEISTSSGDEPGTAGGLISSKFKGKLTWSGSSTDVKVEGKGVVRFLDPTMHNGNTFNTSFISKGGTGLAYGDDAKCGICDKAEDNHRVLELPEVVEQVAAIFLKLDERLKAQRPLIHRYLKLRDDRKAVNDKLQQVAEDENRSAGLARKETQKKLLDTQLKGNIPNKKEVQGQITALKAEIAAIKDAVRKKTADDEAVAARLGQEMASINAELEAMGPVLRIDNKKGTYIMGYMVGACICKCPQQPKMLAACSGEASPGFKAAVGDTRFTLVESFEMTATQREGLKGLKKPRVKWDCAAPKLLKSGGAAGHKVKTMSERYYSPEQDMRVPVDKVTRMDGDVLKSEMAETFGHNESVPSCDACQPLTPEMLCDNDKECA